MALTVRLYDNAMTLITDLGEVESLMFTTKQPGGCDACEVKINAPLVDRVNEYDAPRVRQVQVTDEGGSLIWSGRINRPSLDSATSTLRFVGWWYSLWDTVFNAPDTGLPTPVYPHTLITYLLQQAAPLLDRSTASIDTTNTTDLAGGSALIINSQRPGDLITRILQVATTTYQQYYAEVTPGKVLKYYARPSSANWLVSLADLDEGWDFELDWDTVFSSCQVEYSDLTGVRQRSGVYSDTATQTLLGYDRQYPLSLPTTQKYASGTIDNLAGLFLRENAKPKQRTGGLTIRSGTVRDTGGNACAAHLVKSGDVIRITDLPSSGTLPTDTLDDLRCFSLVQTSYDATTRVLSVVPDSSGNSLSDVISRIIAVATGTAPSF